MDRQTDKQTDSVVITLAY